MVHDVTQPIVPGLSPPELAALHEHDASTGGTRSQGIHDLFEVGSGLGLPVDGSIAGTVAEDSVLVGPITDRKMRLRPPALSVG